MNRLIDFEQGLKHCDQQHRIYQAVLQQFLSQYQHQGIDPDAMLQSVDHARLELHTLKGLCATIGAMRLSQLAASSYQHWSSLSHATATTELNAIASELTAVVQAIENYLTTNQSLNF